MHNKWNYNRNTTNVLLKHQHKFIADCPEAPCVPKAEVIEKFGL